MTDETPFHQSYGIEDHWDFCVIYGPGINIQHICRNGSAEAKRLAVVSSQLMRQLTYWFCMPVPNFPDRGHLERKTQFENGRLGCDRCKTSASREETFELFDCIPGVPPTKSDRFFSAVNSFGQSPSGEATTEAEALQEAFDDLRGKLDEIEREN